MGKTVVICCSIMRAVILISLLLTLFGALSSNDAPQESDVDGNLLKSYGIVETPVITDLRSPVPAPARIKRSPKKNSKESESSEESGEELSGDGSDDTEDSSEEDD